MNKIQSRDFKNLHASCRNFSLTLSDVEFLHVFTATDKAGFSYNKMKNSQSGMN